MRIAWSTMPRVIFVIMLVLTLMSVARSMVMLLSDMPLGLTIELTVLVLGRTAELSGLILVLEGVGEWLRSVFHAALLLPRNLGVISSLLMIMVLHLPSLALLFGPMLSGLKTTVLLLPVLAMLAMLAGLILTITYSLPYVCDSILVILRWLLKVEPLVVEVSVRAVWMLVVTIEMGVLLQPLGMLLGCPVPAQLSGGIPIPTLTRAPFIATPRGQSTIGTTLKPSSSTGRRTKRMRKRVVKYSTTTPHTASNVVPSKTS